MSAVAPSPARAPRRFRGSLVRAMVLVLIPLSMLPVLLMGGAAYLRARALLREQVAEQLDLLEDLQSDQLRQWVVIQHVRLGRLVHQPGFRSALDTILTESRFAPAFVEHRQALLDLAARIVNPPGTPLVLSEVAVLSADGRVLVASRPEWEGLSLADQHYFTDLTTLTTRAGSRLTWSAAPLYQDEFVILTSHPVFDDQGEVKAYILGVAEAPIFQSLVESLLRTQPDARFYFLTEESVFVGRPSNLPDFTQLTPNPEQKQLLVDRFLAKVEQNPDDIQDLITEGVSFTGEPVFLVAYWMPFLEAAVVAEIPKAVVFRQVNALGPFTLMLLFGTVLLLALVIWQGTERLVRPLRELTLAVEHFAGGDFRRRADVNRDDEIGQLAYAFNQMAEELSSLYRGLEARVAERTAQVQAAAEVAELSISTDSLAELLRRTVNLIVERFPQYYQASIFLLDEGRKFAVLRESAGPAAEEFKRRGHKLAVGSSSLVGWATVNNRPRVASDVSEDPIHFKNPLLPETRSEAAIPIAVGDQVLGALDVQSRDPNAFDEAAVRVLQTLANQIAAAIRNFRLLESTQISLEETEALYEASREIAQAESMEKVLRAISRAVQRLPYISAVFVPEQDGLRLVNVHNPFQPGMKPLQNYLQMDLTRLRAVLPSDQPLLVEDLSRAGLLPPALRELPRQMGCVSAAYIPVWRGKLLAGLTVIGTPEVGTLTPARLQPYASLAEVTTTALERIAAQQASRQRLAELEAVAGVSRAVAVETDLYRLYGRIHDQVRQTMGDVTFYIALYNAQEEVIEIPYLYEDGKVTQVDPLPLGEGLTSIVVRNREPLMLVEDTERRARELGAKFLGKPAHSWLGVPLMVGGEVIGVMVVQDTEHEQRFDEEDLRLLSAIAGQVASAIRNARLLLQTQQQAEFESLLNQVTARIRQTNDIQRMLRITAREIRRALGARRARVRLHLDGGNGQMEEGA